MMVEITGIPYVEAEKLLEENGFEIRRAVMAYENRSQA